METVETIRNITLQLVSTRLGSYLRLPLSLFCYTYPCRIVFDCFACFSFACLAYAAF